MRDREQKLVDICFQCVLTVLDHEHVEKFVAMSIAERATWVAAQLRGCGFDTQPVGASWGALVESKSITLLDQRRLRDADAALALPEPTTDMEVKEQLEAIHDAIAALQSLDDLGTDLNQAVLGKMRTLLDKYDRLKADPGKKE